MLFFICSKKCNNCKDDWNGYFTTAQTHFRHQGRDYFKDMLGEDDISPTVHLKLKKAYENKVSRFEDDYGLDGIVVIEFLKEGYVQEVKIKYFTVDNLLTPKITSFAKEGLGGIELSNMSSNTVKRVVRKFFNEHLYRTISFKNGTKGVEIKAEKLINSQIDTSITFTHLGKANFKDQGRYSELKFRFSADGYRRHVIDIPAPYLDYSNVFPPTLQENYNVNSTKVVLKKTQGIADIKIESDNWAMLTNENVLSKTEIKIGKRRNLFQKKWNEPIIGKLDYRYESDVGRYFVKVTAPGFQNQPEVPIDIIDGENTTYDIELKYKSKLKAFMWSSLMPGAGHVYMQKGTLTNNLIPLGTYGVSLAAALKFHNSYRDHRSKFIDYQNQFKNSTDIATSNDNKNKAKKSWNQMQDAKNYFIGMTASAVLTNLATSILLMLTS